VYQELREVWTQLTAPGALFEVTSANVLGQQLRVYVNAPNSLRDVWLNSAAHAENDYLVYRDERWTYAQAHQEVANVAAWLVAQGVAPGDRVAIAMRNYPEWLISYWATVSIGASAVGMNAWWVAAEMRFALEDSQPKVIFCDEERLERSHGQRDALPGMQFVGVRCPSLPSAVIAWNEIRQGAAQLPEVDIDTDSDACIFYTSGTTGQPKGAQLTHRGCVSNLMSMAFWEMAQAAATAKHAEKTGQPRAARSGAPAPRASLITTPLFHVTANNCVAHGMTAAGGKLVHMYKWDAGEALRLVEAEKITALTGVPVMTRELLAHPDFAKFDTSTLKTLGGGGAPLQPDLVQKIEDSGGSRPNTGYGLTETCGIITANTADFFVDKPASTGPAMPVYEAKCVAEDGSDVGVDALGELWVKGAQVIRGYLNRAKDTAETITDGWLHTGDIARIDADGFIFLVDRAKDMVLRGGENVYCAEVEAAIFEHDAVSECAVFAVPDDRLGEEVGAAVVLKAGSELAAAGLRAHLSERIAKHKLPRYLWFRSEELPRNASGKFLKRELRDDYVTRLGEAG
jgi:long-chain acyl-CoA synthetase